LTQRLSGSKINILFLYNYLSSFVKRDFEILKSRYKVIPVQCTSLLSTFTLIWKVLPADCVVCWFGSLYFLPVVLFAKILGKKIIIIAGGYDVACVPEFRYGTMYGIIKRKLGRLLFRIAHIVAAVSRANAEEAHKYAKVPYKKLKLIYHGFNGKLQTNVARIDKKEIMVLTVGYIDKRTIYRKGFLAIARLSRLLPDVSFIIVGSYTNDAIRILKKASGDNINFKGYVSKEDLQGFFKRAKVYLQPSLHEAFGCSVAEAMLYNCIPIVSRRFALPEVVGDSGFYVDTNDLNDMARTVRFVLDSEPRFSETPRQRILRMFPLSKRLKLLSELIENTCLRH